MLPGEIVSRLYQRRRVLGLRQTDLAAKIGISASALSRWELRKQEPSISSFCAWAEELRIKIVLTDRETLTCSESERTPPPTRIL